MADRTLELALRIRADLAQASKALKEVEQRITGIGDAATRTSGKAGKLDLAGDAVKQARQLKQAQDSINTVRESLGDLDSRANKVGKTLGDALGKLATGNGAGAVDVLGRGAASTAVSLGAMGIALGGAVALIGVFAKAVYDGYAQQLRFERTLIATGNVIGTTAGQLGDIANQVGDLTGRYGDAQDAVNALAASGKVSTETLAAAASAAVNLAKLTGDSIENTTARIIKLAEAPSAQLAELNDQYHFLTAEVYDHVKSLEEQGRAEDAARVAVEEFARVHEQRVKEAEDRAGYLVTAWNKVKTAVLGAWQAIKDIGRTDIDARLSKARGELEALQQSGTVGGVPLDNAQLEKQTQLKRAQIAALEDQKRALDATAEAEGAAQRTHDDYAKSSEAITKLLDDGASKTVKYGKAVDDLKKKFQDLRKEEALSGTKSPLLAGVQFGADGQISGGAFDQALKVLQDRFKGSKTRTPAAKQTDADRANAAAQREIDNLRKQAALLDELEEGETRVSEAARVRYEIEQGAYKKAAPALQQQIQAAAQSLDTERKKVDVAKQLADVHLRIAALQGRDTQLQATIEALERLRRKAVEVGKAAAAADIAKLMKLETARSQIAGLEQQLDVATARNAAAEERINIDRQNGLISSVEAQKRLLDIRQQEIAQLQTMIPLLEQAAAAMEGTAKEETLARIDRLKNQLHDLQTQGTLLQTTFRNSFEQGLGDALTGLATGTLTLKQALTGLIRDVIAGMARLAAQQLASIATAKLMQSLFKTPGADKGADVGAGAAKLQVAGAITLAAGGVIKLGASALSDSAKELTAAATLLLVANSVGGFAEGGYTGPGGKYQLAGYVHKGEYVMPQQAVNRYGIDFMRSVHAGTLSRYEAARAPSSLATPRYSFAEGGLAGGAGGLTPQLNLRLINTIDSDALVGDYLDDPRSDKVFINKIGRNKSAIRALVNS